METRNFAIFAKATYCYNSEYVVEHSRMLYEKEFEKSFILKGIEKTVLKAFPKSVKILDKKCTLERIEFEIYPNFDNDISFFVHFTYYNYDKIILMDNITIKSKYIDNLYIYRKNLTPENVKSFLLIEE